MESEQFGDMVPIEESINSSMADLLTIFETNDIDKVMSLCEPKCDKSLYHSAMRAMMGMLKAALTLDPNDMTLAKKATQKCLKLCNKLRKKKFKKITNMLKKNYSDLYSDLELHAELTYAMVTGAKSVLGLLKCSNMKKLAKITYHIGICVNIIAKCRKIFELRTAWESPVSKSNFEAAIRLERGIRNLIVSFLPPKLLRIVNFLGFKGARDVAFNELNTAAFELSGIYSLCSEMVIVLYWIYIEMHGCLGPANMANMQKLVDKKFAQYPNSVLYKLGKTKLLQNNGNIQGSVDGFNSIIEKEFELFHKIAHWELMWTRAVLADWDGCIKYAQILREKTLHSPAIITYLEAIFRYTKGKQDNDQAMIDQATQLFETVPTLRIRYLGKTMTLEKAVIVQSQRYFKNGKVLVAPVLESLYNINYIYMLEKNPDVAQKWLDIIENELNVLAKDNREKYLNLLFYKGVVLKHMKKYAEALDCFNTILKEEKVFVKERSIVPQSHMEIGMIKMYEGQKEEAKSILEHVIEHYSKYVSENIVHIKSYAALRALGVSTDKTSDECEEGEDLENLEGIDDSSEEDDDD